MKMIYEGRTHDKVATKEEDRYQSHNTTTKKETHPPVPVFD